MRCAWAVLYCCRGRPVPGLPVSDFRERLGEHFVAAVPVQRTGMCPAPAMPQHEMQGDVKQHTPVRGDSVETFPFQTNDAAWTAQQL